MANPKVSSKIWQPWLADQTTAKVDYLVADNQSLHSKILQTIDEVVSNFNNGNQKDPPYWSLKTECSEKEQQIESKPFFSLHENTETGRSICTDTRCNRSTSCRNYCGIAREENGKEKTVDSNTLDTCSSQRSKPSMSSGATCTEHDPCFLTTYEMDRDEDSLTKRSTDSNIFGRTLNNTGTIRIKHGSSNYIKSTQSTDEYSNYLKSPNKGRHFRSKFCDKTAITKDNLETQMACHFIERPLKRDVSCNLKKNQDNCKLHNDGNKCDVQDKTFVIGDCVIEQMRTRTDNNRHKCRVCNKTFSLRCNLNRHMRTHTGKKPHQCTVCYKKFTRRDDWTLHISTHTDKKPHLCTICNKKFSLRGYLIKHMVIHTVEKPHQCTVCYKKFTRRDGLKLHIRTHTGEKPHLCTICNKKFALRGYLKSHMITHTGEKPHQCTVCLKKFAHRHVLIVHMRSHTGEKPHMCAICNKKFADGGNLFRHMRIHTGEKPRESTVCDKTFTTRQSLNRHTESEMFYN